ncbi:MAG: hypothetical protein FWG88_01080 [Oscillospiraceae bacterium]|nr:hypothetical protein [Oscillospiraceae bacterium]
MPDKYYLMSKDTGSGPHLIGQLSRLGKGEYEFKYLINATAFPHWFMQIPRLPDITKTYRSQEVLYYILYRVVPESDEWAAEVLMNEYGLKNYDEWTILELLINQHLIDKMDGQPLSDSQQLFYFYSEIPSNAHTYN